MGADSADLSQILLKMPNFTRARWDEITVGDKVLPDPEYGCKLTSHAFSKNRRGFRRWWPWAGPTTSILWYPLTEFHLLPVLEGVDSASW